MISRPRKDINIVIYEGQRTPRRFRFGRSSLKWVLIGVPTLLVTVFVILAVIVVQKNDGHESSTVRAQDGSIPRDFLTEKATLMEQLRGLEQSNKELLEKLSAPAADETRVAPPLFRSIKGMKDTSRDKLTAINTPNFVVKNDGIEFTFALENKGPESAKQTGFIFSILKTRSQCIIYPPIDIDLANGIKFNSGEPFSMARLRPSSARFQKPPADKNASISVVIFSRSGDLVLNQDFGPYEIP